MHGRLTGCDFIIHISSYRGLSFSPYNFRILLSNGNSNT